MPDPERNVTFAPVRLNPADAAEVARIRAAESANQAAVGAYTAGRNAEWDARVELGRVEAMTQRNIRATRGPLFQGLINIGLLTESEAHSVQSRMEGGAQFYQPGMTHPASRGPGGVPGASLRTNAAMEVEVARMRAERAAAARAAVEQAGIARVAAAPPTYNQIIMNAAFRNGASTTGTGGMVSRGGHLWIDPRHLTVGETAQLMELQLSREAAIEALLAELAATPERVAAARLAAAREAAMTPAQLAERQATREAIEAMQDYVSRWARQREQARVAGQPTPSIALPNSSPTGPSSSPSPSPLGSGLFSKSSDANQIKPWMAAAYTTGSQQNGGGGKGGVA